MNAASIAALSPVELISTDPREDQPEDGLALCLSGGGYRAMLFHLGALWRLNEAGYLPQLKRVSSVSGGSITAGVLGLAWPKLDFDDRGVARRFGEQVVAPLRGLAGQTIDVPAVLSNLVMPTVVDINCPPAQLTMRINLGNVEINRLSGDRPTLWTMPTYPGVQFVDMANPPAAPPPAPTSAQRPPPPANWQRPTR